MNIATNAPTATTMIRVRFFFGEGGNGGGRGGISISLENNARCFPTSAMIGAPRRLDQAVRASYSRRMRSLFPLLLCLASGFAQAAEPAPGWWKGNLHTHSLWSDGDDFPEMIADWYKAHGYHFLALSDHNTLSDHERWIPVKKKSSTAKALAKYVAHFGEPWVERRDGADGREVRLKMLSEFRTKVEVPGRFLMIPGEEITGRSVHINATNIAKSSCRIAVAHRSRASRSSPRCRKP